MEFNEVFRLWMAEHSIMVSKSTAERYLKDSKGVLAFFGNRNASQIVRPDIINFIQHELSADYSPQTIRTHYGLVRMIFKWCEITGKIDKNPCREIPLPKIQQTEIDPFTEKEVKKILAVDTPTWVHDAIEIAWRTGMRKGEIFALKWTDIDFEHKFIMVQRTQSVVKNQLELKEPKTKCSRRRISIDSKLTELLKERRTASESEFVFSKKDGSPKIPWELSCKRLKTACKKAGVRHRCFHNFRHTHASILLSRGKHPKIVQERLGHSSYNITMNLYSHLVPTIQQEAADVFEEI